MSEFTAWRASALRRSAAWRRQMLCSGVKFAGASELYFLELTFCQRVELKAPALVPQPGIGVGDATHFDGRGKGRRRSDRAFNFGHHVGRVAGCTHPVQSGYRALGVDLDLEHAHGVQLGRQLAGIDTGPVFLIEVVGGITAVVARRSCGGRYRPSCADWGSVGGRSRWWQGRGLRRCRRGGWTARAARHDASDTRPQATLLKKARQVDCSHAVLRVVKRRHSDHECKAHGQGWSKKA